MKFDRRFAVPAGAAVLLLAWWAAASRKPAPVERAIIIPRGARGAVPDQPGVPRADYVERSEAPAGLEPPAPVLRHTAERRFSNPAGNAPEAGPSAASAAARLAAVKTDLPGGYGAPTAGGASPGGAASAPSGTAGGSASTGNHGPDAKGDVKESRSAPEAGAPGEKSLGGAAANLVSAARGLKTRGDAAAMRAASLENGIVRQIALENKVDAGIRDAIAGLERSGRPVTPEAVAKAAEGVLVANGVKPGDMDLETAVARASGPPPRPVAPEAYAASAKAVAYAPPLPPPMLAEIEQLAAKPPPPRAASPAGALDAFTKNRGVFDKALHDFGVKPEDILAILKVETDLGRNTGKYPLPGTLKAISLRVGPDNLPTKEAKRAGNDLVALSRLHAEGNLGGLEINQVYGSYAGAMGIPQFLPTSWATLSRAPEGPGAPRDPFNFATAAYSVGNYLHASGYSKDVARAIWAYNHSQEYVDKVQGTSAAVKQHLNAAAPTAK